jgi:hypothetical protein
MKYFRVHYSCGCGENEEYIEASSDENATEIAYELAVEEYMMYEGLHGIQSREDIAEEMFGYPDGDEECDLDTLTDEQLDEVEEAYQREIEWAIDYWAEEITKEVYMEETNHDEA